jgi:hypothetical protein
VSFIPTSYLSQNIAISNQFLVKMLCLSFYNSRQLLRKCPGTRWGVLPMLDFSVFVTCCLAAVTMYSTFEHKSWVWWLPPTCGIPVITGSQCARGDPIWGFWDWRYYTKFSLVPRDYLELKFWKIPSGRWVCVFGSTRSFFFPRRLSILAITIPWHCAGITWSFATTILEVRGIAPGLHNENTSSARRSF